MLVPEDRALIVGRGGGDPVDLQVDDDRVSRVHFSAQEINGQIVIVDLGSSNGTIVNGMKIEGAVTTLPGSVIEFGGIVVRLVDEQAGVPTAGFDVATEPPGGLAHPLFQTIIDEAVDATQAATGWLLAAEGRHLKVLAVAAGSSARVGQSITIDGVRGLALAMGQTSAQQPPEGDRTNEGAGGAAGVPPSVLASPCGDEDTVGVLEMAGKEGSAAFTFEDIELLTSLATIAGAAIVELEGNTSEITPPAQVGADLAALAESDPILYRDVVRVIGSMLGQR
jgi:pSer/pThr/pTyr-binding forkhead associated (FHA) protein